MTLYKLALLAHVAFGSLALATFWTTAALRKGTGLHRRIGGAYLLAMVGVMLTALPLAAAAFAAGHTNMGIFLSYLVVITGTPVWAAWRSIRDRKSVAGFTSGPYRTLAWLNLACGAIVLGIGLTSGAVILTGLSLIGLFVGFRMLRFLTRGATSRQWWLKQHYTNIVGSGIAMHIAFLNVGLPALLPGGFAAGASYIAWFGPVAAAVVAVVWLNRRYGRGVDGARLIATVDAR